MKGSNMKYSKKLLKLKGRIQDYEQTLNKLSPKQAVGYRKPGSQKK